MLVATPPDDAPFGPFVGRWETSWASAMRWALSIGAVALAVLLLITWADDELSFGLWFGAAFALGYVLLEAALYRFRGVAAAEVTPEALVVTAHGGAVSRVAWADLRGVDLRAGQMGDAWILSDDTGRLRVSERGFSTDDWFALGGALRYWAESTPLATAPGVETERQRPDRPGPRSEGEVFRAHHPAALFWGIPFFALCAAVGLLSSWESYGDGSWPDDLMLSVGLPVIGLGFVVLGLWGMTRSARRVTFGRRAMIVERLVGAPVRVPYADVTDAFDRTLRTRRGTFNLGERHAGTFHRLLDRHLAAGQISGEMEVHHLAQMSRPLALVAVVVVPIGVAWALAWAFGLNEGAGTLLYIGLLIASGTAYVLWAHRRARRWIAEAEREMRATREDPAKP